MSDKLSFRQAMENAGASNAQLNSQTYKMAEQLIAEDAVDGLSTASEVMDRFRHEVSEAKTSISNTAAQTINAISASQRITNELERAMSQAADVTKAIDSVTIKDKNLVDALNMYTLMLSRTKDILGDERMTDEVSVKAIEAASFGAWRAIMGPKDKGGSKGGMWS